MTVAGRTTGYESETPSGIRVYFQQEPKRLYKVNDVEEPSVTEVLKILSKGGGMNWWSQGIGIDGTLELIRRGLIGRFNDEPVIWNPDGSNQFIKACNETVKPLLVEHKLSWNNTLNKAGDRGTSVHSALESWGETRQIPDPEFYPEEERGYIVGLVKFLNDIKLSARPKLEMETMVGSVEHGFAGRYDLAVTLAECEFVTNVTPVRGETREVFPKGRWLLDLKTSKSTYDTHHLQLAAYELAAVECGYSRTVGQAVVRVGADGNYVVTRNRATAQDFLSVLQTYNTLQDLKGRK